VTAAPLILLSPLTGWVAPLAEAPDPVFADLMLGDGVAIDPTGDCIYAPCDGEIVSLHAAGHAVSLRADNGAEILMHIGLDTVALGGLGFVAKVKPGQRVAAGAPLIGFDLDLLARRAPSLMTPIILINGDRFAIAWREMGRAVRVGEPLMEISPVAREASGDAAPASEVAESETVLNLAHGLHARPAARLSQRARAFPGAMTLACDGREADAKSPLALMCLGLAQGARLTVRAEGPGALAAAEDLTRLISHDLPASESAAASEPAPPARLAPASGGVLTGVCANPGLAIGPAVHWRPRRLEVALTGAGVAQEQRTLSIARLAVAAELAVLSETGTAEQRSIAAAHGVLLSDPGLNRGAEAAIARGLSAGAAWREAMEVQAARLRAIADPRIAERADDLMDLEDRVLRQITGEGPVIPEIPRGAILLARDLLPTQLMALSGQDISGLCTARGGPTSHMALLAGARNIPTLVAVGEAVMAIPEGAVVILDAGAGLIRTAPTSAELAEAAARLDALRASRSSLRIAARAEARTADGFRVEVFANLGSLADAVAAVDNGAEGCGLLRTEFLFLDRETAPSEDEQHAVYQAIADALDDRPLVIRLLDIGADKPAAYLPLAAEENPALGVRGVRVSLRRRDLLRVQLAAILRVTPPGRCRILTPMVSSRDEMAALREELEVVSRDLDLAARPSLGAMIETPAAAMTADILAGAADFFSIGTNDLAQYALAMDRGHADLAADVDGLHPAVLRLIGQAAEGARRAGRRIAVCGGLASDPAAVPILIGLGVTELSVRPHQAPDIKHLIRGLTLEGCQNLARRALSLSSPIEVRALSLEGAPP
jgi:phosphocarrier protein FPr/phosphocarrier protein